MYLHYNPKVKYWIFNNFPKLSRIISKSWKFPKQKSHRLGRVSAPQASNQNEEKGWHARRGHTSSLYRPTNLATPTSPLLSSSLLQAGRDSRKRRGGWNKRGVVGGGEGWHVWGQKTIGATRAETKATRGDTQYGDASGSLTTHNARSRVNFCAPCACLFPHKPSPLFVHRSPSCSNVKTHNPRLSPFLILSLSSCIRNSAIHLISLTRGDDTFNCTPTRSGTSNKFHQILNDAIVKFFYCVFNSDGWFPLFIIENVLFVFIDFLQSLPWLQF